MVHPQSSAIEARLRELNLNPDDIRLEQQQYDLSPVELTIDPGGVFYLLNYFGGFEMDQQYTNIYTFRARTTVTYTPNNLEYTPATWTRIPFKSTRVTIHEGPMTFFPPGVIYTGVTASNFSGSIKLTVVHLR